MDLQKISKGIPEAIQEAKDPFIRIWDKAQGSGGAVAFETEVTFLRNMIANNAELKKCTPLSFYVLLIEVAYNGLTLDQKGKALAYVIPTPFNVGTKQSPSWETRAIYTISPYGELDLRIRSRAIKHSRNPVVVFKGDFFIPSRPLVQHERKFESMEPIASYIEFMLPDGTWDNKVFDIKEIVNFKTKSKQPNSDQWTGGFNGGPTIGMIEAKTIKHAFRSYGKIRRGNNTALESELDVEDEYNSAYTPIETETPTIEAEVTTNNSEESEYF